MLASNKLKKKISNIRSPGEVSPGISQDTRFFSNKYTDLSQDYYQQQQQDPDSSRMSPFAHPPSQNLVGSPELGEQISRMKQKTSKLLKRTNNTIEDLSMKSKLRIKAVSPKLSSSPKFSNGKVLISGPQNFKHLYHMDTTAVDQDNSNSSSSQNTVSLAPSVPGDDIHKPSPTSQSSSLFSDDYFTTQYPGTPSSPVSGGEKRVSDKPSLSNMKKLSSSTMRTSRTDSLSSMFDKTPRATSRSSFSTSGADSTKHPVNATIPETSPGPPLSSPNHSLSSPETMTFSNPFYNSKSDQESISSSSRRLLEADTKLESTDRVLKRNKYLNEASPVPAFRPPEIPASPAHTSHSEESSQTIKYDGGLKEDSISPISNTATYITPKLSDFLGSSSGALSPREDAFPKGNLSPSVESFDEKETFQKPEMGALKGVKKSKSFKDLKKSLNKRLALPKKISFKNTTANESSSTVASDNKSLTGFSPDIETSILENSTELLNPLNFEQDKTFDIDFDKEVGLGLQSKEATSKRGSDNNANQRSRHGTVTSTPSQNSSFSAVSYATTKPVEEKRRSTMYIRQSWLKDEALAIIKDDELNKSLALFNDSDSISKNVILEEDVQPLNPQKKRNTNFGDITDEAVNASVEKELSVIESELENASAYLFGVTRRRSEADMDNIALLEVEQVLSNNMTPEDQSFMLESELEEFDNDNESKSNVGTDDITSINSSVKPLSIANGISISKVESSSSKEEPLSPTIESSHPVFGNSSSSMDYLEQKLERKVQSLEKEQKEREYLPMLPISSKSNHGSKANVKRLTLHTPTYLVNSQQSQKNQSPLPPVPMSIMESPQISPFGQLSTPGNDNRLSFVSSRNTIFLQTPTKKFGHGKSLSIASSVYSNGPASAVGHSRSSSLYNADVAVSVDDLLLARPGKFNSPPSAMSNDVESIASGYTPRKKISVDRNSYIQFNYHKFEDFKHSFDENSLNKLTE